MKMTKIAFWRKVKENIEQGNYGCIMIKCERNMDNGGEICPLDFDSPDCLTCRRSHSSKKTLALAEAYIKRHESKSKKKDHILDTTKKVEEPKPIKTVGIDNSDVTLALTPQHDHIVDKHEMVEPKPISFEDPVPEYVYWLEENCIIRKRVVEFVQKRYKSGRSDTFALVEGGENPYLKNLYRTLEEAVMVAKKLWNGEGK